MQIENYPFNKLPFSSLFKAYIEDFDRLAPFFSANPLDQGQVEEKADSLIFKGDKKRSAEILEEVNRRYDPDEEALRNIERLKEDQSLAIITGQQLCLYGGALFTFFKTVTTIHLARRMEKKLNRPVIPVFWLADEDHDYDEVRSVSVFGRDERHTFALGKKEQPLPPVAELTFSEGLNDVRGQLREVLHETDFTGKLWELLDSCFEPGKRFDYSFGELMVRLFSRHGLVLAGSNHPAVKGHTRECMKRAIGKAEEMREALQRQTNRIKEEYHQQVTLYDSNLFYLDPGSGRLKISREGERWKTETGREWDREELMEDIDQNPERFSPNVFLRPILQDLFLPTLGYVAGPGETAYYAQMKEYYRCFDLDMPLIFPRISGTFIEPPIQRILGELPFDLHEYDARIEDLESTYVDRTEQVDIEEIFSSWKKETEALSEPYIERIKQVDPTLEGASGKALSAFHGELDKLKGKVYRSVKQQEQTQLDRIDKIKEHLFPDGSLQERTIAAIYFMNKYGVDIWDRLLDGLEEEEPLDRHKLFYL